MTQPDEHPAEQPQADEATKDVVTGVLVGEQLLSVDEAIAATSTPRTGGLALFVGLVREVDHGQDVTSLDYSGHPSATAELERVVREVCARHDVQTAYAAHRVGHLEVGDVAVVVSIGAMHRAPALEACREVIDTIKQQVPIWKQQHVVGGSSHWVGL